MNKSHIFSTLAGAVTFFLLGWIWYGLIMMDFFQAHTLEQAKDIGKTEPEFLWMIIGFVIISLIMSLVYAKWSQGVHNATKGFVFGAMIGAVVGFGVGLIFYSTGNFMDLTGFIVDGIFQIVHYGIVGALIAIIHNLLAE